MKKILLIALLALSATVSAQLKAEAEFVKERTPDIYNVIRSMAIDKWDDDHEMIVYTINKQSKAFVEFVQLTETKGFDMTIAYSAISKWTERATDKCLSKLNCDTDWEMVMYTTKKQLKASKLY